MTPTEHAQRIRELEFKLHKAENGLAMPYDYNDVFRLRILLNEARKACAADAEHMDSDFNEEGNR